jgi:hypothetical protein
MSLAVRGIIDYTLAKRSLLRRFRKGSVDRFDICDAHPELTRAAKHIGQELDRPCPVCARESLRLVRYVYGDQLKQLSGRVVYPESMVADLAEKVDEFRCYAVEVCLECGWNHLAACFMAGRRHDAGQGEPSSLGAGRNGSAKNGSTKNGSAKNAKVLRLRSKPDRI